MESFENSVLPTESFSSLSNLEVRCPGCFKLFSVDLAEVSTARPEYKCSSCDQKFWFDSQSIESREILGMPLDWIESPSKDPVEGLVFDLNCPKCHTVYQTGETECRSCGVVFEKFEKVSVDEPRVPASDQLKAVWEEVIFDYEDPTVHDKFLAACQKDQNIEYASAKYGSIIKANPSDETALKMISKILAISTAVAEIPMNDRKKRRFMPQLIWSLVFFVSGGLIVAGYTMPYLRNLMGIGAAMLFLSVAIKLIFRRAL